MLDEVLTIADTDFEDLITQEEIDAVRQRAQGLLEFGAFPGPSGLRPALPWPPM